MLPGLRQRFRLAPRRRRLSSRSVLVSSLVPCPVRRTDPPSPLTTRSRNSFSLVLRRRVRLRPGGHRSQPVFSRSFSFHGGSCRRFTVPLARWREQRSHHRASQLARLLRSPRFFATRRAVSLLGASQEQSVMNGLSERFDATSLLAPGTAGRSARANGTCWSRCWRWF